MSNYTVLDTNVLMLNPNAISEFENVIIPLTVVAELDNHKKDADLVGYNSRKALKYIEENKINLEIEEKRVIFDRLKESNKQKDSYYEWYLKEIDKKNKTENKLIIGLTLSMFVITSLVITLIKGL